MILLARHVKHKSPPTFAIKQRLASVVYFKMKPDTRSSVFADLTGVEGDGGIMFSDPCFHNLISLSSLQRRLRID